MLLLVYPYAWFLYGSGYSDAFFLAVTLGAFLLLERDHPVLAGLVGFVALAARPTGTAVLIGLVAVALERRGVLTRDPSIVAGSGGWWTRERARWHVHRDRFRPRDAGVLLAAGGLLSFMFFCFTQFDDAFAFATVQKAPGWDQPAGLHTWLKIGFFGHLVARLTRVLGSTGRAGASHARVPGRPRSSCCAGSGGDTRCTRSRSWHSRCSERPTSKAWVAICSAAFPSSLPPATGSPHHTDSCCDAALVIVSATGLIALASLFGRRYYLT